MKSNHRRRRGSAVRQSPIAASRRRRTDPPEAVESLEGRVFMSAVVVSGAAGNAAAITATRDAFRAALGGGNVPGANGSFGGLRREINWDGVPAQFDAPNALPADFFNVNSPRGVVFSTPGTGFQVSSNPADAATPGQPAAADFGNLNPTYTAAFEPFSPTRLFTPVGSNVTDVTFFLPGTTTSSTTNGFGAMFSDVDTANSTSIQFFDPNGASLGTFFAPAAAGDAGFSFLGVSFNDAERVARVRITTGAAAVGPDDVTQNAANGDVVVMDDFLYGEPGAFTVVNTNDTGSGSLRQAMTNANAVTGKHPIDFNIPGAGVHTIVLASDLPASTGPVAIDGYTQAGSSPNTLAVGGDAVLTVEVDAAGFRLFQLQAGNSLIRGLVLNDFHNAAVDITSSNNVVAGNYIGTDPTGTLSRAVTTGGTAAIGVNLSTGNNTMIGGTSPADRNVLSANFNAVAGFNSGNVAGTQILNNYVGTDRSGTLPLGNTSGGLNLNNPGKGGYTVAGNVVSANGGFGGISVASGTGSDRFTANLIGTAADGASPLGNTGVGIRIENDHNEQIGGLNPGDGNTIAFNTGVGVAVGLGNDTTSGVAVLSNRIFSNGGLGIDLNVDGVTPNDPADTDVGPNRRQNFPVTITATNDGAGTTTITGLLNSTPSTPFVLQFFGDPTGSGQGRTLVGQIGVITDAAGNVPFSFTSATGVPTGQFVTATATNLTAAPFGDTSEFASSVAVQGPPPPPPTFSIDDVTLAEGTGAGTTAFTFTVTRTGSLLAPSSVQVQTADSTAAAPGDYAVVAPTVLNFGIGVATQQVVVQVKKDAAFEADETFFVNLSAPVGASIADPQGVGTITNDDAAPPAFVYVSDLNPTSATNGWGAFERDKSNGETGDHDGHTIKLNGTTYARGLGVHANSDLRYNINKQYSRFTADVGVDDEVGSNGNVIFQVFADGVKLFDSGPMTGNSPTQHVDVDLTNRSQLQLVVLTNGSSAYDHADWADAKIFNSTTPPPPTPDAFLSDLNPTSATNGWGAFERDKSNGETGDHDGHTIKLNGATYARGLGVHANSDLRYNINKQYSRFTADVGIDDEVNNNGSVIFQVFADGILLFDSGVMTGSSATKHVDVNITNRNELKLIVLSNGSTAYDHADWADAKVHV